MTSHTRPLSQYFTPAWAAEALVERHFSWLSPADFVIEPTCGNGSFLSAIPDNVPALGIELDPEVAAQARANSGRPVLVGDFLTMPLDVKPTCMIGNIPFTCAFLDGLLQRGYDLLPDGGKVGVLLGAYMLQTAERVASYADRFSISAEMIPRNIFPGLELPLVFATFAKDRERSLVGFGLYREAADALRLPKPYREALAASGGSVWVRVIQTALSRLGGEASLDALYSELEGARPTRTRFWREQIRKVLRQRGDKFLPQAPGRYKLADWTPAQALGAVGFQFGLGFEFPS